MGKTTAEIEELAKKYGATVEPAPNELEDLAKKYGATVEHPTTTAPQHGASGPWGPPMDVAERFQEDHPLLSAPAVAVARFGKGVVDAARGMKDLVTAPSTEKDKVAGHNLPLTLRTAKRLIVDPSVAEYQKSKEADTSSEAFGHALGVIPVVGPTVAGLTEQALNQGIPEALGSLAMLYLGGKASSYMTDRLMPGGNKPVLTPKPSEQTISATSTMIESGVPNATVNKYAEQTIPMWRQAAAELGKTKQMFPERGIGTEASKRALREGADHAVEIADHAVDIADRPFQSVLRDHGKMTIDPVRDYQSSSLFGTKPETTVKSGLLADLDAAIADHSNNPPLQNAIRDLRARVERAKTFNDLQSLKVLANKQGSGFFEKGKGAQINASADAAYSWKILGDAIRANMYPELSRISGTDLSAAGRMEAIVMDARDGLRQHVSTDVLNPHNRRMQQTYWEHVRDGSLAHRAMWKRALMLEPTPGGMFNRRFLNVMGGETPQMPSSVPFNPRGTFRAPGPADVTGTQMDLIPHEATPVRTGPGADFPMVRNQESLLTPPPGVSRAVGEDIFKVQQRANREARSAPPKTIGPGKQLSIGEKSTPQHTGDPGQPGEFFPGRKGTVVNTEKGGKPMYDSRGKPLKNKEGQPLYEHDYRGQEELFSVKQTPVRFNPMQRTTYTMQDLTSMLHEIHDFVQRNPNHPQVSELLRDIESVRNELNRRQEAHKVPKTKKD